MKKKNIYQFFNPLIFKLEPEFAHNSFLTILRIVEKFSALGFITANPIVKNSVKLKQIQFKNRVGLAAGLDKNASYIDALSWFGFGTIEVGTVTPKPQKGNPKPRLFRLNDNQALINRMGFNNVGLNDFIINLKRSKWVSQHKGILGVNLGMNRDTNLDNAYIDYCLGIEATYIFADYLVINISSPNTTGLRKLQENTYLTNLLSRIKKKQTQLAKKYSKNKPIFLKLSPDLNDGFIEDIIKLIKTYEIEGIILTNTSISREGLDEENYTNEKGGLSGKPLFVVSNSILSIFKKEFHSDVVLVGSGGIMSGSDASQKFKNGADLIQLYTALIYKGPAIVSECIDYEN
tara:strand:+ start:40 stop:1080 length:1041 start_codon:yes stop_codon:yes gene_type:complete